MWPKSRLEVKDGLTFLDIVVRQVLHLRRRTGACLPLVLMNSFATRDASLEALDAYADLPSDGIAADFVQSKAPKLDAGDLVFLMAVVVSVLAVISSLIVWCCCHHSTFFLLP